MVEETAAADSYRSIFRWILLLSGIQKKLSIS